MTPQPEMQSLESKSFLKVIQAPDVDLLESVSAEQTVLGCVLVDALAMSKAAERVRPEHFSRAHHQEIYRACLKLAEMGENVDVMSVPEVLEERKTLDKIGGRAYINELAFAILSAENVGYHIEILLDRSIRRAGYQVCLEGAAKAGDEGPAIKYIEGVQAALGEVTSSTGKGAQVSRLDDLMGGVLDEIKTRKEHPEILRGIETGFHDLDTMLNGLQASDLLILAARPSMGKTAFCLNIASHVALRQKKPVMFFSLEMTKEQLAYRMLCSEAKLDAQRVRTGSLNTGDFQKAIRQVTEMAEAPLYIDDQTKTSVIEMQAKARQLMAKLGNEPLGLVVVDYLQLMEGRANTKSGMDNRQNEIAAISRGLKIMARELKCPVLALSQLSRAVETRQDKRPMLSDLRDSGSIEQDADVVMFIYRDEYYNPQTERPGMADIIIAKQRNGPIGTIPLLFKNNITRFLNPIDCKAVF